MRETRVFHCRYCDHKMRFPADRCGYCQAAAPFYNRGWFLVVIAGTLSLAVLVFVAPLFG